MLNNCLITQLKGSVDNNSLKEFGIIKFKINTSNNQVAFNRLGGYDNSHPVIVVCANGGFRNSDSIGDYVTPFTAANNSARYFRTGSLSDIRITEKYNLGYFRLSLNNLEYATTFDLSEFAYCTKLVDLMLRDNISIANADLKYLWNCLELSSIEIADTSLSGDLVTLVQHMITNGRSTTGNLVVKIKNNKNITFGSFKYTSINTDTTVYWQSASKLYMTQMYSNDIKCYGYTDEEIATNTTSGGIWEGKTVTKCG